jgi:hypothetical protein
MSWVPLPWWKSTSTMATRPSRASDLAAMAALLSRQKPP